MNDDLLTRPGAAIKAMAGGKVGGYAILFTDPTSPDRENDYFDQTTDFDLEDRRSVKAYWHHRLDKTVTDSLGRADFQILPQGVWAELKLQSDPVSHAIFELAERDELAWSSGSVPHMVRRKRVGNVNHVTEWPVIEFSVLHRTAAAEPRAKVTALKSLTDALVKPLINSAEQKARAIHAELIVSRYERLRDGIEKSLHDDDKTEMQKYYEAMSTLEIERCEERRRWLERLQ